MKTIYDLLTKRELRTIFSVLSIDFLLLSETTGWKLPQKSFQILNVFALFDKYPVWVYTNIRRSILDSLQCKYGGKQSI